MASIQGCTKGVLIVINYQFSECQRLAPRTQFKGGRITETDVLTLAEAAKFASAHAGTEITPADFLRAAKRGEIALRAIVHRTAKLQRIGGGVYCNAGQPTENTVPSGSILTLPLSACGHLAATSRASWRTFDQLEMIDGILKGYTIAELMPDEPDFETTPDDCRVMGNAVHAVADAYMGEPAPASAPAATPAPVVADGPAPLTTGDIAHCFNGLKWNETEWKKPLGDKPKWLSDCVAIPGQRGVSETRWNPVLICAELLRQGHVSARTVRAKFQTVALLKPWLEEWKTYEADNLGND